MTYLAAVLILAIAFGLTILLILGLINLLILAHDELGGAVSRWRRGHENAYPRRIYDISRNRRS